MTTLARSYQAKRKENPRPLELQRLQMSPHTGGTRSSSPGNVPETEPTKSESSRVRPTNRNTPKASPRLGHNSTTWPNYVAPLD